MEKSEMDDEGNGRFNKAPAFYHLKFKMKRPILEPGTS